MDNNNLGRYGHRLPSGYFRLETSPEATRVALKQSLASGSLAGTLATVANEKAYQLEAFVDASNTTSSVFVVSVSKDSQEPAPQFTFVNASAADRSSVGGVHLSAQGQSGL